MFLLHAIKLQQICSILSATYIKTAVRNNGGFPPHGAANPALLLHAIMLQQICCGFTAAIKKTAAKMLQSFIILIRLPDLSALRRAVKSKPREEVAGEQYGSPI